MAEDKRLAATDLASIDQVVELERLRAEVRLKEGLPHLHGYKFYKWSREFFESRSKYNLVCAGNQLGKSTTMIRKCVHWATAKDLWSELWGTSPRIFLYLYPTQEVAAVEVYKKWIPEILPANDYKTSEEFGWELETGKDKTVSAIHFRSGVSVYFKTYSQSVQHLQTVSAHGVFTDEELPEDLFPELRFRLAATNGYFCSAFTATLGQEYWRAMIEEPQARKPIVTARTWQVSMFDCQYYEDGSASSWTTKRIAEEIAACPTEKEVFKRVYGKFVKADDLRYPSFDRRRNVKAASSVPGDWIKYSGVDIGSGVGKGHPSAIAMLAVRPDFRYGRIFRGWRGDGVLTTAGDVFLKYLELRGDCRFAGQYYDYSCKDFQTIANRNNEAFTPADKRSEYGDGLLNTLFKHGMLVIDDVPELYPLVVEFESVSTRTTKTTAKDDYCDAARYSISSVPWDLSALVSGVDMVGKPVLTARTLEDERRKYAVGDLNEVSDNELVGEIAFWQEYIDA